MKKNKMIKLMALIMATAMLLLTACGTSTPSSVDDSQNDTNQSSTDENQEPSNTNEPKYGGTMTAFTSADPKTLDPAAINGWDQNIVAANLLEGLVRLTPDGTDIEPGIAETWDMSDDGLTWTFKLREGAKFHNGREVLAKDFKYSFERVLNPKTASPAAWMLNKLQGVEEFQAGTASEVSGINIISDYELALTLKEPFAPFISMLTSVNLAVVPQEEVEKLGEDFGQHVVAAGPFKQDGWNFNQDLTLVAFDDYWAGRPYLDAVKFKVINDENTRIVEFDAKTLDVAWITPAHYERITNDPVLKNSVGKAHTLHTSFLVFNMDKEPFKSNQGLREAMWYALDTQAVIDMLQNRATVADYLLPSSMLGAHEMATTPPYDVEKAKESMKSAGYESGLDKTFDIITPPWNNNIKILEIYQQNLKEIGVKINIVPIEFPAYMDALNNGQFDIAWADRVAAYPDSDAMFYPLLHSSNIGSGGNYSRYSNPEIDALIDKARASVDEAEREQLYKQIDELVVKELPYAYLSHNIYVDIAQPYVKNYCPSALDVTMYHRVWLDK